MTLSSERMLATLENMGEDGFGLIGVVFNQHSRKCQRHGCLPPCQSLSSEVLHYRHYMFPVQLAGKQVSLSLPLTKLTILMRGGHWNRQRWIVQIYMDWEPRVPSYVLN